MSITTRSKKKDLEGNGETNNDVSIEWDGSAAARNELSNKNDIQPATNLDEMIDQHLPKFSGQGDAESWLSHVIKHFKQLKSNQDDQLKMLPMLLEDDAYLWYVKNLHSIENVETFYNLFLQRFSSKNVRTNEQNSSLTANLLSTMAREIIKSPSFYDGMKEDVDDWLEKLESRFIMAGWDDEQKLRFISIHLQGDAYKWWINVASKIKTWSMFTREIRQAFGSTKAKEIAFEQLRNYKQTLNQSIIQYYEKIIELCKKVDSNMSDTMKLHYLMAGMKDSMKIHMGLHDPQTTDAFLKFARKFEDILSLINLNQHTQEVHVQDGSSNFPITLSAMVNKKTNGEVVSSNRLHEQRPKQRFHNSSVQKDEQKVQQVDSNLPKNKKPKLCYNCGTPGHFYRDCARSHFDQRKHQ